MQTVTREQFDAFLASNATQGETEIERDGEYAYECWLNQDGEHIAFITFRAGEAISFHIAD